MATYIEGSAGQTFFAIQWNSVAAVWKQWQGRQIFYAGESIGGHSDENIDVTISGYLFVEVPS